MMRKPVIDPNKELKMKMKQQEASLAALALLEISEESKIDVKKD